MTNLKPCPFCGKAGEMEVNIDGSGYWVGCSDTKFLFKPGACLHPPWDYFESEEEAIEAWNKRTPPPVHDVDEYYKEETLND
jgi:Lar family restriction alleviation protein